ncbi:uncharacterized protein EAE97_009772 [Botrytis byssoidea]|uniref:Heterokaryon incompatibility domain-containing protein n=1 Tax=Botrytis byssoidea TaxID=139641 RepID=A0A9P5LYR4_9HELO|nr:uncharacterized protein EAE97_009772 [Botrytis byssoidea]KAF7928930.1 hypothetical protein EAE97_009772 [Botrytis byssoidea]
MAIAEWRLSYIGKLRETKPRSEAAEDGDSGGRLSTYIRPYDKSSDITSLYRRLLPALLPNEYSYKDDGDSTSRTSGGLSRIHKSLQPTGLQARREIAQRSCRVFCAVLRVGTGSFPKTIVINGTRVEVRANLANVLVHISPATPFLWIDALCINQDDVIERNHQVMQIGSIYKQVREVIVWLGDKTDQGFGNDAETFIPDIGFHFIKRLAALQKDLVCIRSGADVTIENDELLLGAELVSLGGLYSRPYWNRLWILQEVLLAKDLVICWSNKHSPGLRTVTWAEWSRARHLLENFGSSLALSWDRKLKIKVIEVILESAPAKLDRLRETGNQRWPFNSFLEMFPSSECRVQADKIYGLLGIISDPELCNFPVDYARPLFDTYVKIINCYTQTRSTESPAVDIIRLSQSLQLALNGPIPVPGMALKWCEIEQGSQAKLFNHRGYVEGLVIASSIARRDLPQRLEIELPGTKSTRKILSSKIRDLDSCSKRILKDFDSVFGYATRENLSLCDVGKSATKETSIRFDRVCETRFFISSTGEIGIALAEVRDNNFICRLKDTHTTLIIRQRRDRYQVISRTVLTSYADTIPRFGGHAENVKGDALDFWLDPLTLQTLTCPIESKRGIPY